MLSTMTMQSKIPPSLHALVLKQEADGRSAEAIAAWLWTEYKLETSERAVQRLLARYRHERAEAARELVRNELRQYLVPTVHRLARVGSRAAQMEREARERAAELRKLHPQHPGAVAEDLVVFRAMDRQLRAGDLLLSVAGLTEPEKPAAAGRSPEEKVIDHRAALLKRVQELVEKVQKESAAAQVGAADPAGTATTSKDDGEPPVH